MRNIYAFGSVVRGEIDEYSDIDLLLITDEKIKHIDSSKYSIYTPDRIKEMYIEGNPFAWHLYYESKLIFSDNMDFLADLGKPSVYKNAYNDLIKFKNLFTDSVNSIFEDKLSIMFDLAMIFLSLRNFATCYSLDNYKKPIFSRISFEKLFDYPLNLDYRVKKLLMMSRISSTRGIIYDLDEIEVSLLLEEINNISNWFNVILQGYESRI